MIIGNVINLLPFPYTFCSLWDYSFNWTKHKIIYFLGQIQLWIIIISSSQSVRHNYRDFNCSTLCLIVLVMTLLKNEAQPTRHVKQTNINKYSVTIHLISNNMNENFEYKFIENLPKYRMLNIEIFTI